MSDDRLERELILRRILVERTKGTSFEELTEIIRDMVESQRQVASRRAECLTRQDQQRKLESQSDRGNS